MKKAVMFLLLLNLCLLMNAQVAGKTIPVTTSSKKALALYNDAMKAYQDVDLAKFNDLTSKSLVVDPDFFMVYYQKAMFAAYLRQEQSFIKFATAAANSKSKISSGESILKDAVRLLLENRNADLTGYGNKLVKMYPEDVNSYLQLMTFQYLIKDFDGQISTLNNALKLPGRNDFIYNLLAYAYMEKGQFKEAEAALDKYIELSPQLPNPWDSKGDLYMRTKEYAKAYENYMKANSIDTAWSKGKALKAKSLADSDKKVSQKYSVPVRTDEQKFNRAQYIGWYWVGLSAKIAKEEGKDLYESGRRAGEIISPNWGKQNDLDGLVNGWVFNCASYQRAKDSAPVVRENQDGSVTIITDDNSSHDYFPEGGLIAYDEFLKYWKGILDVIAEYKGATMVMEHQDSLMIYTFRRK